MFSGDFRATRVPFSASSQLKNVESRSGHFVQSRYFCTEPCVGSSTLVVHSVLFPKGGGGIPSVSARFIRCLLQTVLRVLPSAVSPRNLLPEFLLIFSSPGVNNFFLPLLSVAQQLLRSFRDLQAIFSTYRRSPCGEGNFCRPAASKGNSPGEFSLFVVQVCHSPRP